MPEMQNRKAFVHEQFRHILSFLGALLLMCFLTVQFADVWQDFYSNNIILPFYRRGNWVMIAIYATVLFLFFKVYNGFKVGYLRKTDIVFSQLLAVLGTNVLNYLQISLIARNFANPEPMLLLTIKEMIVVICWTSLMQRIYFALYPPRKLIIVYDSPFAAALVLKMSERVEKYMICESVSVSEGYERITEKIRQYDGVIIHDISADIRNALIKFCFQNQLRAYIVPKVSDIILSGADTLRLFDTPLLLCRNQGLTLEQRLLKRLFDIIFSVIALLILSPLMLICALAVKCCDGGKIFYKQKRLTEGGREFDCCKFRSMIPNAEEHGVQLASEYDTRITPVGRILRRFRLDELPQLFNILKGEMSVVGPRPERPELTRKYQEKFPEFEFRLSVKAGLTGYAQVTGGYHTSPYDKLRMDLMYIENYSLLKDMQIILMTVKTMLFPSPANPEDFTKKFNDIDDSQEEKTS
ncbi:MAG: sugar transferase [Oscillospiraceae bacterium]